MSESEFINKVLDEAKKLGGCDRFAGLFDKVRSIKDLIRILRTPQGAEFCVEHNFPSQQLWEEADSLFNLYQYGIFVNQDVTIYDRNDIYIINGRCDVICEHPIAHNIKLLHGSEVELTAINYAVATIDASSDSNYKVKLKDDTVVIL